MNGFSTIAALSSPATGEDLAKVACTVPTGVCLHRQHKKASCADETRQEAEQRSHLQR